MHLFSYNIFILINASGALKFTAHKNVLEKKYVKNLPKYECTKAGLGVILTIFSNNYE